MAEVYDIRSAVLSEASTLLAPAINDVYEEYGLDITLTLLLYYAAKGSAGENGLTDSEKDVLIDKCYASFSTCVDMFKLKGEGP